MSERNADAGIRKIFTTQALLGSVALCLGLLQANSVAAQNAVAQPQPQAAQATPLAGPTSNPPDKGAPASTKGVEEVVVTAERRAGTVQSTPISITAVSGTQLQARGITTVSELGYETPGISERNSGPGQTEFEMRGVASAGGSSPTVGFYLDDVSLTAPANALEGKVVIDPNLYDLNRVEVLRGPQGTLYGSGSMGGTIRLITNQPDPNAFTASLQTTGSGTQSGGANYSENLMVNVPLVTDKLAVRVVGTDSYTSGWISRTVLNPFPLETNGGFTRGNVLSAPVESTKNDVNDERLSGFRTEVFFHPIEDLTITPTILYQRITQGAPNYVDIPPGVSYETHYEPYANAEPYSDTFDLYTLPIKYRLPWDIDFTSVTAYYTRGTHLNQDSSEIGQDFLTALIGVPGTTYGQAGELTAREVDHTSQFSEEARFSSTGPSPFQWVAGAFFSNYRTSSLINTTTPGPLVADIFGAPSYFNLTLSNNIKQYAGFGEGSYRLGPFRLTAGVRYYSYQNNEEIVEGGGLITGPGAPIHYNLPASASGFNPKFNLAYEPTKDLTFYAQVAKGFRPGGANTPPPETCPSNPLQYNPDSLWSYEGGEKVRLFDNRLILNGAIYFEDWSGIQQLITEQCGATYTANAGKAHIYGSELEAVLRVTPQLTVSSAAGYAHATLVSVEAGTGFTTGELVQAVPEWTDTTSVVYTQPINDRYDLVLRATNVYVGTETDLSFQLNHLPSRDLVNLRAGLYGHNGLTVSLFCDNLLDKRAYIDDPEEVFSFVPALNRAVTNQPRTAGVQLTYAFGGG